MANSFRYANPPRSAVNRSRQTAANRNSDQESNDNSSNWLTNAPSNALQNTGILFSIVGVLVSLILSIWAIVLTYRFGENTDQISALKTIASKQQTELSKLTDLLKESQHQTTQNEQQIKDLDGNNLKLIEQSKLLRRQLGVLSAEQNESNNLRQLARKAAYMKLKNTALMIGELNTGGGGLTGNNPSLSMRNSATLNAQRLLESELSNVYLLEHEDIAKEWAEAYSFARIVAQFQVTPDDGWYHSEIDGVTKVVTSKSRSIEEIQQEKLKMFNSLVDKCMKLYFDVIRNLVWKGNNTGVF